MTMLQAPTTSTASQVGQDAYNTIEQQYPTLAWMLTVPELSNVIQAIAALGITDQNQIQSAIQSTNWWQTQSETAKTLLQQQATDPAQFQQSLAQESSAITATFAQMGLTPTVAQVNTFAYQALLNGWSTQQITDHIGQSITPNGSGGFTVNLPQVQPTSINHDDYPLSFPTKPTGAIYLGVYNQAGGQGFQGNYVVPGVPVYYVDPKTGEFRQDYNPADLPAGAQIFTLSQFAPNIIATQDQNKIADPNAAQGGTLQASEQSLGALAKQYMVNVSPQVLGQWAVQIASGQSTQDGFQSYLQSNAVGKFPWMAQAIQEGQTPLQIVNPYANMVANELGVSPNNIDWTQPQWAKLLSTTDPKTGGLVQRPEWEATQILRTDPSFGWDQTPNAKSAAYSFVQGLQQTMGTRSYSGASPGTIATPASFGTAGG